jgi:hypothetical protein
MFNRSNDALFQLVKSLGKSEKRNFKLFVKRNSGSDELKSIQLFDALDKMGDYNEGVLLKKTPSITKIQISNLKALLYKQILASLRIIKDDSNVDLQLHELMDHARILYNKGLYLQCLKLLDKLKELAREYHQLTHLQQALFFEKKIEVLYITRSLQNRASQLTQESDSVFYSLQVINKLSNLSLQLYSWYIQHGHARNERDVHSITQFFEAQLPVISPNEQGFYQRLYLHQSYCWFAFIQLDFLNYYRQCQKWVDVFEQHPYMIPVETASYIKGMHNLMSAHFDLRNEEKMAAAIKSFEVFSRTKTVKQNPNSRILVYQYLYTARINLHFLQGSFDKGLRMVPFLEKMLKTYGLYLDAHRVLVFYYKIASLYFGSGHNGKSIDYLNRIINSKADLRTDLQCYARLLHLIAHYELGNFDLLEYLIKSVYRFMARLDNLSKVEEAIFAFLRRSFDVGAHALKPEFEKLLHQLKQYEGNPLEARAFAYLDIISWLQSKISGVLVQDVIKQRNAERRR